MSDLSKQLISSIPITHMSRLQWIQFKDAIQRVHELEEENGRLKAPDEIAASVAVPFISRLLRGIDRISFRAKEPKP